VNRQESPFGLPPPAAPGARASLRGSQYASGDYQAVLAAHGVVCSMSRRANCWDNAVAERFFSTLKIELAHDADGITHAAAHVAVAEYLESSTTRSGGTLSSAT